MSKIKTTIDKEIKQLYVGLNELIDTLPTHAPKELKELRDMTLHIHRFLETAMESRIIYGIDEGFGLKTSAISLAERAKRLLPLEPILSSLTFMEKVRIIKVYRDVKESLIETLEKVNTYRNRFVHPKEFELRREFDASSPKGKQNVRDLLRCLTKATQEMDLYFKNYVNKS